LNPDYTGEPLATGGPPFPHDDVLDPAEIASPDDAGSVILSDGVVTLRPWSNDDAGFMAAAFVDPAIRRYNGVLDRLGHPAPPLSVTDAAALIDGFGSKWRAFATTRTPTGAVFAITDTVSAELVGCCGVDDWSKADVAQIGYWLAPNGRGRGFATRAVTLLTRWLFGLGAARVFLTIVAGNEASVAVARRAGFVYEGTMRSHSIWKGERFDVMWFGALPLSWTPTRETFNDADRRAASQKRIEVGLDEGDRT
jgi:RimJ/RimL family protein N-acetyltransferase